ncbi:MAG: TrkA C-terminal domain-containing protein, partial [Fulvivirga sp.]|nr:TrkA C-terminal domain-containing protein [Fulvivirga sp.]
ADNVFITLTAKEINPEVQVIAKASEYSSEKKLHRAGASYVVMPDRLGGMHMANLVTKPYVIEFLELLNGVGDQHLELMEVDHDTLKDEFRNKSLGQLDIRNKTGATILAFKDREEGFVFNPHSKVKIDEGDVLIVLGSKDNLKNFNDEFVE